MRSSTAPEMAPLLRVLRSRIEGLTGVERSQKDGLELYRTGGELFLQLEIRRDHVILDLWLTAERVEEARASGIGRTHPFLPGAVKVRFDRAEDLTRVTSWLEESHRQAPARSKAAREAAAAGPQTNQTLAATKSTAKSEAATSVVEPEPKAKLVAKPPSRGKSRSPGTQGGLGSAEPKELRAEPSKKAAAEPAKTATTPRASRRTRGGSGLEDRAASGRRGLSSARRSPQSRVKSHPTSKSRQG